MVNFVKVEYVQAEMEERDGAHHYTTPAKTKTVGITTILGATKPLEDSEKLADWKRSTDDRWKSASNYIFKTSGPIGTDTHSMCEAYLKEEDYTPKYTISRGHFENLKGYLSKIDNIRVLESRIYSEKLGIAGTVDCVAEYNGILSIIDFKTKRSNRKEEWMFDVFLQATAYSLMWAEITGEKIKQIVILVSTEVNTSQIFIKDPTDYTNSLKERIEKYRQDVLRHQG